MAARVGSVRVFTEWAPSAVLGQANRPSSSGHRTLQGRGDRRCGWSLAFRRGGVHPVSRWKMSSR